MNFYWNPVHNHVVPNVYSNTNKRVRVHIVTLRYQSTQYRRVHGQRCTSLANRERLRTASLTLSQAGRRVIPCDVVARYL